MPTLAWDDYDNDGFIDLFVADQGWPGAASGTIATNLEYHHLRNGRFERITNNAIGADRGFPFGGTWGDFDNDGNLDLFVPNWQTLAGGGTCTNFFYRNLGNGT